MVNIRRWYIFLVCAISLQSIAWAVITLLRNLILLGSKAPVTSTAFQIAVIVIGLPVYLVHWLWAQRLARQDIGERESALRRLYLYGMLAGFLGPFSANAFTLFSSILSRLIFALRGVEYYSQTDAIFQNIIAMVILALSWIYHLRIANDDSKAVPETGIAATMRRLYIFGFSAAGLTMVTMAVIHLLRSILFQIGGQTAISGSIATELANEVARLVVGMSLWLIFWRQAQRLFVAPNEGERESALRKFYLYGTVFIVALGAVTYASTILDGVFRRLLSLPSMGDIRIPLPIVIVMAVLWAFHATVLREDAELVPEAPRQAGIRRLYLYLVAAVGLAAFLIGLGGDISVLIRALSPRNINEVLRAQLALFTAVLIAGLPVWLLPWRQVQIKATAMPPVGAEERHSAVRRLYLYFYFFVATMTVLASAVYIVSRLLSLLLGERSQGSLLSDLGQAIAFLLIGIGMWLFHGSILRSDGQINRREQASRLTELRGAILDLGESRFGYEVLERLKREIPELSLDLIRLPLQAEEATGTQETVQAQLAGIGFIVVPWTSALAGGDGGTETAEIVNAICSSPARKLLVPMRTEGWEWAGVDRWNAEALAQQTVRAVRQMIEGEEVKAARPVNIGGIIGIIFGVIILLLLIAYAIAFVSSGIF